MYAVERWGRLIQRCAERGETVVLESRYVQSPVQPRYLAGAPAEKLRSAFAAIGEQIRDATRDPGVGGSGSVRLPRHSRNVADQ